MLSFEVIQRMRQFLLIGPRIASVNAVRKSAPKALDATILLFEPVCIADSNQQDHQGAANPEAIYLPLQCWYVFDASRVQSPIVGSCSADRQVQT